MLLTFSKDSFVNSIINGIKIHSIREDKYCRWKVGMKIHFWRGNPRNIKQNPYQFGETICNRIDDIDINYVNLTSPKVCLSTDTGLIILKEINLLNAFAQNDGFENWEEMKDFFPDLFIGKIIYWNNFKEIKRT